MASLVAVEAPKAPPVNVAPMSNNVVVPGNGSSLYDSTKERATLTGTVQNGDEDYNAVINGSPGLAKLQDILLMIPNLPHEGRCWKNSPPAIRPSSRSHHTPMRQENMVKFLPYRRSFYTKVAMSGSNIREVNPGFQYLTAPRLNPAKRRW